MDQGRKDLIQTIYELSGAIEPRLVGMHPDEFKEDVKSNHNVDLEEDDEDKLDALCEKLARLKKNRPVTASRTMAVATPVKGTPPPVSILRMCETEWQLNDRVRHVNRPDWGEGDVLRVDIFQLGDVPKQKLDILFNRAGRKTVIVSTGMLEAIPKPEEVKA